MELHPRCKDSFIPKAIIADARLARVMLEDHLQGF
jgi:hypothetical protein